MNLTPLWELDIHPASHCSNGVASTSSLQTQEREVGLVEDRRYYGLDALRGAMMMLGILLHGAVFYLAEPPASMPIPVERNAAFGFDVLFHFIHSFRIPAFFVLAGFFAALLVLKRGLWGSLQNRAARVLAPLLAAMVTVLPLAVWIMLCFMQSVRFGSHDFVPDPMKLRILVGELKAAGVPVGQPSLMHLWFLYYLCMFYLLLPVFMLLSRAGSRVDRWLASPGAFPVLGAITAASLWPFHGGQVHEGFIFITPHLPSLIYYGLFFAIGYLLHACPGMLRTAQAGVWYWLVLAWIFFPLSLYLTHRWQLTAAPDLPLRLAMLLAHGLCTWALIYLVIGAALRWFDSASPWVLYLSQSAYWIFLTHMPVLALGAWWMVQFDMNAVLKFLCITIFTCIICFTSYHYLVQRSWLSVFLNGRRFDQGWPWRKPSPKAAFA
jgi:glucans biosynthesis protein C